MKEIDRAVPPRKSCGFDLDDLLRPAPAFTHPRRVIDDPDLTLNEKRAILASWASDACAIEAAPASLTEPVGLDDVIDALSALDQAASGGFEAPRRYRRILENRIPGVFGRNSGPLDPGRTGPGMN